MTHFDLAELGLTEAVLDYIETAADEASEAKPAKAKKAAKGNKPRRGITTAAWEAAAAGQAPEKLEFPASNYWSQKHADALHGFMAAGDADGLTAYPIGGTNTYAKALRSYRDACLAYLATLTPPPVEEEPVAAATIPTPAKKKAGKKKAVSTETVNPEAQAA